MKHNRRDNTKTSPNSFEDWKVQDFILQKGLSPIWPITDFCLDLQLAKKDNLSPASSHKGTNHT